jgi:hypothetical protein
MTNLILGYTRESEKATVLSVSFLSLFVLRAVVFACELARGRVV